MYLSPQRPGIFSSNYLAADPHVPPCQSAVAVQARQGLQGGGNLLLDLLSFSKTAGCQSLWLWRRWSALQDVVGPPSTLFSALSAQLKSTVP